MQFFKMSPSRSAARKGQDPDVGDCNKQVTSPDAVHGEGDSCTRERARERERELERAREIERDREQDRERERARIPRRR